MESVLNIPLASAYPRGWCGSSRPRSFTDPSLAVSGQLSAITPVWPQTRNERRIMRFETAKMLFYAAIDKGAAFRTVKRRFQEQISMPLCLLTIRGSGVHGVCGLLWRQGRPESRHSAAETLADDLVRREGNVSKGSEPLPQSGRARGYTGCVRCERSNQGPTPDRGNTFPALGSLEPLSRLALPFACFFPDRPAFSHLYAVFVGACVLIRYAVDLFSLESV